MLREVITKNWHKLDPDSEKTESAFKEYKDQSVLVACSGGADSIALALVAYCNEIDFSLAYIEHEISALTGDCAVSVKQLAQDFDVPFATMNLKMTENGLASSNVEAVARDLRYKALAELQTQTNSDIVLTGHHNDDLVETFLINLLRGSGSGIASLSAKRNNLARPLLHWRKKELEDFVTACGYDYFSDPGNIDPRFVRNRIRHEVLELLNEVSQRDVVPLLSRTAQSLSQDNEFLSRYASSLWPNGDPDTRELSKFDPVLQKHALRAWIKGYPPSFDEMSRVLDVVNHKIRSTQLSGNRTIWRSSAKLFQDVTDKIN